jgi:predicted DNA-binding transcriptional regulator AlpA
MDGQLKLIKAKDVMDMLSISRTTLWRWVNNGAIPEPVRIAGSSRWHLSGIKKMIEPPKPTVRKRKRLPPHVA